MSTEDIKGGCEAVDPHIASSAQPADRSAYTDVVKGGLAGERPRLGSCDPSEDPAASPLPASTAKRARSKSVKRRVGTISKAMMVHDRTLRAIKNWRSWSENRHRPHVPKEAITDLLQGTLAGMEKARQNKEAKSTASASRTSSGPARKLGPEDAAQCIWSDAREQAAKHRAKADAALAPGGLVAVVAHIHLPAAVRSDVGNEAAATAHLLRQIYKSVRATLAHKHAGPCWEIGVVEPSRDGRAHGHLVVIVPAEEEATAEDVIRRETERACSGRTTKASEAIVHFTPQQNLIGARYADSGIHVVDYLLKVHMGGPDKPEEIFKLDRVTPIVRRAWGKHFNVGLTVCVVTRTKKAAALQQTQVAEGSAPPILNSGAHLAADAGQAPMENKTPPARKKPSPQSSGGQKDIEAPVAGVTVTGCGVSMGHVTRDDDGSIVLTTNDHPRLQSGAGSAVGGQLAASQAGRPRQPAMTAAQRKRKSREKLEEQGLKEATVLIREEHEAEFRKAAHLSRQNMPPWMPPLCPEAGSDLSPILDQWPHAAWTGITGSRMPEPAARRRVSPRTIGATRLSRSGQGLTRAAAPVRATRAWSENSDGSLHSVEVLATLLETLQEAHQMSAVALMYAREMLSRRQP
ncbi:hypothetical protein [Sabulicella rubraurantiaca]|uniref:hypothetical protein n=1 Tax=Sabulicella rubraurantiaca TaxID=2811429 RepID=UPI001A96926A|nr:hypothetical protein [Sabulicella rubraurantiaca]